MYQIYLQNCSTSQLHLLFQLKITSFSSYFCSTALFINFNRGLCCHKTLLSRWYYIQIKIIIRLPSFLFYVWAYYGLTIIREIVVVVVVVVSRIVRVIPVLRTCATAAGTGLLSGVFLPLLPPSLYAAFSTSCLRPSKWERLYCCARCSSNVRTYQRIHHVIHRKQ